MPKTALLLPLLVTATVGVLGWFAVHRLTVSRDRANKRRDLRTQYLLEAYRRLERASHRSDIGPYARDLESAIADIHLFGSRRQVTLAQRFADQFAKTGAADLTELLESLRGELRRELGLEAVTHRVSMLRVEPHLSAGRE